MSDHDYTRQQLENALGSAAQSYALSKNGSDLDTGTFNAEGAIDALRKSQQQGHKR